MASPKSEVDRELRNKIPGESITGVGEGKEWPSVCLSRRRYQMSTIRAMINVRQQHEDQDEKHDACELDQVPPTWCQELPNKARQVGLKLRRPEHRGPRHRCWRRITRAGRGGTSPRIGADPGKPVRFVSEPLEGMGPTITSSKVLSLRCTQSIRIEEGFRRCAGPACQAQRSTHASPPSMPKPQRALAEKAARQTRSRRSARISGAAAASSAPSRARAESTRTAPDTREPDDSRRS